MIATMFQNTRYNRQETIPLFGKEGQHRLSDSSVAVIGAGGVKSPILFYLAAAGIGRIRIIDFDSVEMSNLNRQILYSERDVGRNKAEAAAEKLLSINSEITIEPVIDRVTFDNFDRLLAGFDLIFEGGSSDTERKVFNKEAVKRSMPYVHASAHFNYSYVLSVQPGTSACFECVYFDPPRNRSGPVPVLGCACGIAGSVAASEAITFLMQGRFNFVDRIWFHDGWSGETLFFPVDRQLTCSVCGSQTESRIT
jgi:molybdopterin/thiamine biosynthesis adenylyltransferase